LSVAVSYASVRAGVKLPLPEPSEASLRIALAAASTAAAALATTAAATSVVPASPPKPPSSTTSSIGLISLQELPKSTENKIIDSEVS